MSLINGLSAVGTGLKAVGGNLDDWVEPDPGASAAKPAAVPTLLGSAPAPQAPTAPAGGSASAPPSLLPIYEAAAKRTGVPIDLLIAQGKQESNFDPNAIGSAGEIGLHQIKPSTAANPGYGLRGIDPATLKDPAVNINFAADYLKARAGNPNFNDPASVDAALRDYNGGGDPNYVANVRQHMGAT